MFSKNIECQTRIVTLEKVTPTCLLGDEDVARNTHYQTTVQCVSAKAVVWVISKEDFLYYRYSKPLWDVLEKGFTAKMNNYAARLSGNHNNIQNVENRMKVEN